MGSSTMGDPFLWDVESVANALCAPGSPWTKDGASLGQKIMEEEIDGKTLLTFEEVCSRQELMECLGISRARQKASLLEELVNLRATSTGYRSWRAQFLNKQRSLDVDEGDSLAAVSQPGTVTNVASSERMGQVGEGLSTAKEELSISVNEPRNNDEESVPATLGNEIAELSLDSPLNTSSTAHRKAASVDINDLAAEYRPPKRKRLEPVNLSQTPVSKPQTHDPVPWENSPSWAYLGKGGLPAFMVQSTSDLVSTKVTVGEDDGEFSVSLSKPLPAGRRLAVNRLVRKMLQRNSQKEVMIRDGIAPAASDPDDELLEMDDLPEEWDERTLREMREEEEDIERERNLKLFVSPERVRAIIQETIQEMTAKWNEVKLEKYQRKAYSIWTVAMRKNNRNRQSIEARLRITDFDRRLNTLTERIVGDRWQDENDVRLQSRCLEQTLEDKLYQIWLISVLELRTEPPKPDTFSKPLPSRPKQRARDPMDEVLTSSDEEDFIVPDALDDDDIQDAHQSPDSPNMQQDNHLKYLIPAGLEASRPSTPTETKAQNTQIASMMTPEKQKSPAVGLAASEPRAERQKSILVIDLTTPTKSRSPARIPPSISNGPPDISTLDVEAIAKKPMNYWGKECDRWRLALYMLRELSNDRRAEVFNLISPDGKDERASFWLLDYIDYPTEAPTNKNHPSVDNTALDLTRIYLSFLKCRYIKEKTLERLKTHYRKRLLASEQHFEQFCYFILSTEALFPQASQIYKPAAADPISEDDMDISPDPDQDEEPKSQSRKAQKKEIVRDKGAVKLREDQQKRAEEQAARRLRLRATLAADSMPQDKSRLIINEAKDEDQSLIYVNEDIGKRIKDHQIDGVRFLWNQIIQPLETRQGCLLAHTMGLGKTMQVITFLVAIAEAASSDDASTRFQIPEDLRKSKTIVLCPSGLVDNWMDELLKWAPDEALGPLSQLDSTYPKEERVSVIETWANTGGVLVLGYDMFKGMLGLGPEVEALLLEKASLVVADEAHKLKNPSTKLNKACSRFLTTSRIALTGSPLANHVEEYYVIINWVAPNFLGPVDEFRAVYVREIDAGFYKDSTGGEKRRALKLLQVLKETMAPKVNRATVKSCLANDLPPKSEFVITVRPTVLQRSLYQLYINALTSLTEGNFHQAQNFNVMNDLGLICAHPRCFNKKIGKVKESPRDHASFPMSLVSTALRLTNGADKDDPLLSHKTKLLTLILDEARKIGDKVLVFSQSIITLDYLESLCRMQRRPIFRLDGKTKIQQRQDITKRFNLGNIEVGLISTTAGGVGLNIQGANRVVIFDSGWNPVDDQQAVGRAYRIGQTKEVKVYHLMVAGTFEEDLHNRAVFKTQLAQRVVDKKNPISWSARKGNFVHHMKEFSDKDIGEFRGKDSILDRLMQYRGKGEAADGVIVSVVSTDTFEEEDKDAVLTAQEREEANQMVTLNRLRSTNPAEYEKRMRDQQQSLGHDSLGPISSGRHPTVNSPPFHNPPVQNQPGHNPPDPISSGQNHPVHNHSGHHYPGHHYPGHQISSNHPSGHQPPVFSPSDLAYQRMQVLAQQRFQTRNRAEAYSLPLDTSMFQTHARSGQPTMSQPAPPPTQARSISHHQTLSGQMPAPVPAPRPLAGANTFIGQRPPAQNQPQSQQQSTTPKHPQSQPAHMPPLRPTSSPASPSKGGIFNQTGPGPEKAEFTRLIAQAIPRVRARAVIKVPGIQQSPEMVAQSLTESIHKIRADRNLGFLPDNQQWKCLKELTNKDRFVVSAISGHFSAQFLAMAPKGELSRRVGTLEGLSDKEFQEQVDRITRSQKRADGTPYNQDKEKAIRGTTDRQQRPFRLPSWASDALDSANPAANTPSKNGSQN